jgi:hypothetical protein
MSTSCYRIENENFMAIDSFTGTSDESVYPVSEPMRQVKNDFYRTFIFGERSREIKIEIDEIATEGAYDNWDGYGGKAMDPDSWYLANEFFNTIPTTIPAPEVSLDPDGEISFEWYKDRNNIFSVSIGGDKMLTYAGVFGANKARGAEYFSGLIPQAIMENLLRIYA